MSVAEPRIKTVTAQRFASIRMRVPPEEFGAALASMFEQVWNHLNGLEHVTVGPAIARHHSLDQPTQDHTEPLLDVEAGFPVQEVLPESPPILASTLPAGPAATSMHEGPYERLPDTYERLRAWIQARELTTAGAPYEIYWIDHSQANIADELRTEIVWPLAPEAP